MNPRHLTALIIFGVLFVVTLILTPSIIQVVDKGTYVIKQSATTGELTAHMQPGPFGQWFGSITEWPVGETFYFTKDPEGGAADASIEVRFNDGSVCMISGTCRVDMPRSEAEVIGLIKDHGYKSHTEVEDKLILPVIRRSLIMTANLMSAKESYSDRRADFFRYAWDQIENGVYQTKDDSVTETEIATGQVITKIRKSILTDKETGAPLREHSALSGLGIRLSNFEIKNFVYEERVKNQIATQQEALMAVQTARANAQKAEQDKFTIEAQGQAEVMKARYEEEQKKVRAMVQAEQEKAVAVIAAEKQVAVAEKERDTAAVNLDTAKLEKQRRIELATGESESKRMVLAADGALQQKLEAWANAQKVWADAFSRRAVPSVVMGGRDGSGTDSDAQTMMEILSIKAARDLALDMNIPSPTSVAAAPSKVAAAK